MPEIVTLFDHIGIAVFAISGALAAARKGMDIFGFMVIAVITSTGGGTVRDVVLGAHPVFWISNNGPIIIGLIAAIIIYFSEARIAKSNIASRLSLLRWMDAAGIALFASLGAQKALALGASGLVAIIMGIVTAVTGGMLRDIICNDIPLILTREIYATAAFAAAGCFVACSSAGIAAVPTLIASVLIGFSVRAVAMVYDFSLPASKGTKT